MHLAQVAPYFCGMRIFAALIFALVLLPVLGCGAKKQLSADEYFSEASTSMRDGSYDLAIERYRELLDQHPFSDHSEEAELRIAHAHFLRGSCPEAVASLADFQRRHPTSPHLAFVGYLLGQCYEKQMRSADRDQSASQNAHAYYLALTQQYPDSPFAALAREQIERCRERIAAHELLVARFYERRGNLKATETRLLDLINRFNDTETAGTALYALGELYRQQGNEERAALAFAAVSHHHPNNGLAEAAREALAELGVDGLTNKDPLPILQAQSGRSRTLALTQIVEVPALEQRRPTRAFGPGIDPTGRSGPFGTGGFHPSGGLHGY